jgi:hypothetical protein
MARGLRWKVDVRTTMKVIACCAFLMAFAARADDAKAILHDALDAQAAPPSTPPSLPDSASERARTVQQTTAHGKKGAAERAAHAHQAAAHHGDDAAEASGDDAKSAQGAAASAAKSANADSHAAAGQARAAEARGGQVPGGGKDNHPKGQPPGH